MLAAIYLFLAHLNRQMASMVIANKTSEMNTVEFRLEVDTS